MKKQEILNKLIQLEHVLKTTEMNSDLQYIQFKKGGATASNGLIHIRVPIDFEASGYVKGKEFLSFLKTLQKDEIEIIDSEDQLKIKQKKVKAVFKKGQFENDSLNQMNQLAKLEWRNLSKEFKQGVEFASKSTLSSADINILGFVNVTKAHAYACDNDQFSAYTFKKKNKNEMMLQNRALSVLLEFDLIMYTETNETMLFMDSENTVICVQKLGEAYPEAIQQMVNLELDSHTKIKIPESFRNSVQLNKIFSESGLIEISISNKKIVCRSKSTAGSVSVTDSIKFKGSLKITVNSLFLEQFFNMDTQTIYVSDSNVVMKTDQLTHIISLHED